MVTFNRLPGMGGGGGSDEGNPGPGWEMHNVDDMKRWIDDNKAKVDEGGAAVQSVVSIGTEVASAACVKWFREVGWEQSAVADLTGSIAERIMHECDEGRDAVLRDCALIYAGSGNTMLVMVMAFVSYSLIGVRVAEALIDEADED